MQTEQQPTGVPSSPPESNATGAWPPKLWRLALGAVIAGALGYVLLISMPPIFTVPLEISTFPEQSPVWMYQRLAKAQSDVDFKNYSIVFGITGALMGACCVLCAFGARSMRAIILATVGTAVLGVVGTLVSNWVFTHMRANDSRDWPIMGIVLDSMKQSILGYALLWSLIGLGVGVGLGSIRGLSKSLVAGISGFVGGALGAMTYVLLTAQFIIGTTMNQVVPFGKTNQAIWMLLFPMAIAICIALGSGEKQPKADKQQASA